MYRNEGARTKFHPAFPPLWEKGYSVLSLPADLGGGGWWEGQVPGAGSVQVRRYGTFVVQELLEPPTTLLLMTAL